MIEVSRSLFKNPLSHKDRWWIYHKNHPEVMEQFIQVVSELMKQGYKHYSADGVLHIVRFRMNEGKKDEREMYKINNNYSAYMSRYFLYLYPEWPLFFERRKVKDKTKTFKIKSHWNN